MVERKFREDRRGLTLIELVCAVAILAIISATVGGAMVVATNSYRSGTTETALQQEAQFTANAIESLIVDATDTVDYTGGVLTIANVDYTYEIIYKSAEKKLVYTQYETAAPSNVIALEELIADHVSEFDVDASAFASARNVQLYITMENEGKSFATAYSITSRNNPDAGTPIEVTARINVETEITLEPNQEYFLRVDVIGPANKNCDYYFVTEPDHPMAMSYDDTISSEGVLIKVGSSETGGDDGLIRFWVETEAKDSSGNPMDKKCVTIHIRRVKGFDFSPFTLRSGTELKENAEYSITATPNGTNLSKVVGAPYDEGVYAYVDPNTLKWSFDFSGGTGIASDYAEIIDPPGDSSNELIFRLKQDLPLGAVLKVKATAQHPAGVNKTGTSYGSVVGYRELVGIENPMDPQNGMLRRGDDCNVAVDLDPIRLIEEEWQRNHPGEEMPERDKYNGGFTGNIYFRYKADDGTHASVGHPNWIKMSMQGSDPNNFQFKAADFEGMKYMKDYTLEILYSFRYNTRDNRTVYYPASAFPSGGSVPAADVDSQYIYTLPMYAFSMQFQDYEDGFAQGGQIASYLTANGTGIGTFERPLELDWGWGGSVRLRFNVFTGANVGKAGVIESVMSSTKRYRWNGTSWQLERNAGAMECKERNMPDSGILQFEPNNSQMKKGVVYKFVMENVMGETYVDEPVDGNGGRGVIYIRLK